MFLLYSLFLLAICLLIVCIRVFAKSDSRALLKDYRAAVVVHHRDINQKMQKLCKIVERTQPQNNLDNERGPRGDGENYNRMKRSHEPPYAPNISKFVDVVGGGGEVRLRGGGGGVGYHHNTANNANDSDDDDNYSDADDVIYGRTKYVHQGSDNDLADCASADTPNTIHKNHTALPYNGGVLGIKTNNIINNIHEQHHQRQHLHHHNQHNANNNTNNNNNNNNNNNKPERYTSKFYNDTVGARGGHHGKLWRDNESAVATATGQTLECGGVRRSPSTDSILALSADNTISEKFFMDQMEFDEFCA